MTETKRQRFSDYSAEQREAFMWEKVQEHEDQLAQMGKVLRSINLKVTVMWGTLVLIVPAGLWFLTRVIERTLLTYMVA